MGHYGLYAMPTIKQVNPHPPSGDAPVYSHVS